MTDRALHSERHETPDGTMLIEIFPDDTGFSPRENDNLTIIRGWHKRMDIGDGPNIDTSDYDSFADMIAALQIEHGELVLLAPLYWYEHSGVTCRMGEPVDLATLTIDEEGLARFRSQVMDDAGWDSGVAGVVLVTRARVIELGAPEDSVQRQARSEVAEYADYLNGNVYGYTVSTVYPYTYTVTIDAVSKDAADQIMRERLGVDANNYDFPGEVRYTGPKESERVQDSCWGFIGDWDNEHGALSEARASAGVTAETAMRCY